MSLGMDYFFAAKENPEFVDSLQLRGHLWCRTPMRLLLIVLLAFGCRQKRSPAPADDAQVPSSAVTLPPTVATTLARSASGFSLPTERDKRRAIGNIDALSPAEQVALTDSEDFAHMSFPGPSDWLSEHFEAGQTFDDYERGAVNRISKGHGTIFLLPIGGLEHKQAPSLKELTQFTETFFQVPVKLLPEIPIESVERGMRERETGPQLLVQSVFGAMRPRVPSSAYAVLALTLRDIYPGEEWNFVFGQATFRERIGVHSLARYFPSFYGESDKESAALIRERAYKVLAHEIGHMFGLQHCTYYRCIMNGSNGMSETDGSPLHLCPVCLRKLQLNARFDLEKRYQELARHLLRFKLENEAAWHASRVKRLRASTPNTR